MKSILISIKPKYAADILNGKKTIEIRKRIPKCDLPINVYIYCTKNGALLFKEHSTNTYWAEEENKTYRPHYSLNGKVVAKFTLNKIEQVLWTYENTFCREEDKVCITKTLRHKDFIKQCCLSQEELNDYIGDGESYAWHISNLEIFDKPKEISEFFKPTCNGCPFENTQTCHNDVDGKLCRIAKAPQSWCYVGV